MKRIGSILIFLMATSPVWAAKDVTVAQLKELLTADQQAKKSDADVAKDIREVVLTEELTTPVMSSWASRFLAQPRWNRSTSSKPRAPTSHRPPSTFPPRPRPMQPRRRLC